MASLVTPLVVWAILRASYSAPTSVAVLPFVTIGPDQNDEYLADGLTEELIDALASIEGLRVTARTSAFAFKGVNRDVREIGNRLGVESVIEGSIRRDGRRLRVTVQLNRTSDGFHLWSEKYEGTVDDVFSLQEQVAQQVSLRLNRQRSSAAVTRHHPTAGAYELYLRGRQYTRQTSRQGSNRAIALYKEAITLDAKFAEAYVALADEYSPIPSRTSEARRLLEQALQIDPNLWTAHAATGRLKAETDWDWQGSDVSFQRAIQLNPGAARAHRRYGRILSRLGRHAESIREMRTALVLDPLSEDDQVFLAEALFLARRFDEAIAESQKTLDLYPHSWAAYLNMGLAHAGRKQYAEAILFYQRAMSLNKGNPGYYGALGHAYAAMGNRSKALEYIALLSEFGDDSFVSPMHFARIYGALGDTDHAFRYLDQGIARHDQYMLWILSDPRLDPLRNDPRYLTFLTKMKLPLK